jgi:4-amino-4-deoxy-L-arabinose transferase-like glycosyltransferase
MLAAAIGLGLLLARWSWQVGGPAAAVTATVLYALNPMILGHAPLVKNDISMALVLLAVAYCVWRMGRRLHVAEALALGLLCGIAATTKYSGVIAGPIAAGLLGLRAMLPQAWTIFGRQVGRRWARLLIVGVLAIGSAALTWAVIWTVYGFRYAPTPDGTVAFDPQPLVTKGLMKRFLAERGPADATLEEAMQLRPEDVADQSPGAVTRALLWTYDRRLLPQAWLYGLLFTHQSAVVRQNYLFGEYSLRGWWYYFPVAMLAKTPLATLAAAATAAGIALLARRRTATAGGGGGGRAGGGGGGVWLAACLAVPPGVYMLLAMASSLNIGLRHVLPVFPFAFLGIGVAASWFWARSRRLAGGLGIVLALGLAAETLAAYPNYIAFFNAASGGPRGGLQLLGDSNLDWGQDLKLLAEWHRRHPERELYASFFTSVDPAAYGLSDYRNTLMADAYGAPMAQVQPGPGRVLAISATNLQASYAPDRALREAMRQIREQLEPIEVLGGTVYLYDLDTPRAHRLFGSPP